MRAIFLLAGSILATFGVWAGAARQAETPGVTEPSPKLTPEQVVSIQLRALKNNDDEDHGIQVVFKFASPANKATTGPIQRFILMVKNPVYRSMLNYQSDEREPMRTSGDAARQKVILTDPLGKTASYIFVLSRQKKPPCENCWMTDSVIRVGQESGTTRAAAMEKRPDQATAWGSSRVLHLPATESPAGIRGVQGWATLRSIRLEQGFRRRPGSTPSRWKAGGDKSWRI